MSGRRHFSDLEWYAYIHVEGPVILKRYHDQGDIKECRESDFVQRVTGPFDAKNRETAMEMAKARLR